MGMLPTDHFAYVVELDNGSLLSLESQSGDDKYCPLARGASPPNERSVWRNNRQTSQFRDGQRVASIEVDFSSPACLDAHRRFHLGARQSIGSNSVMSGGQLDSRSFRCSRSHFSNQGTGLRIPHFVAEPAIPMFQNGLRWIRICKRLREDDKYALAGIRCSDCRRGANGLGDDNG